MKVKVILITLVLFFLSSSLHARKELSTKPAEVFKGCAKCHGQDAQNEAYGRSEKLAEKNTEELKESIMFFKESTFERKGVMLIMSKQVKHLDEQDVENLAQYISNLRGKK